jgi:hypothetical protein
MSGLLQQPGIATRVAQDLVRICAVGTPLNQLSRFHRKPSAILRLRRTSRSDDGSSDTLFWDSYVARP